MPEPPGTDGSPTPARASIIPWLLKALLLLALLISLLQLTGAVPGRHGPFTDALLVLLATAATLAWLTAELPLQNVLAASGFLALLFAAAQAVRGIVLLQPASFSPGIGPQLGGAVPLVLIPLWVVALLSSRGTARWLLWRWRGGPAFGLLVIGAAALLFATFELALETYAAGLKSYWVWDHLSAGRDHRVAAPGSNYLFWFMLALAVQVIVAPWLINKKPAPPKPVTSPLIILLSLVLFLAFAAAVGR